MMRGDHFPSRRLFNVGFYAFNLKFHFSKDYEIILTCHYGQIEIFLIGRLRDFRLGIIGSQLEASLDYKALYTMLS